MVTAIKKWGNSQGLRFSKEMLDRLDISVNDEVNVEVKDNKIIITKAQPSKVNIEELFTEYNKGYKGEEVNWGESVGEEW